jgi:tetratricopeptide (TPR) repeat protein
MVETRGIPQTPTEPSDEVNAAVMQLVDSWRLSQTDAQATIDALSDIAKDAAARGALADEGRAHHILGYISHYLGRLNTSIRHYETARRLFTRVGNQRRVATMELNNGENYRLKGEFHKARRLYRSAYETGRQLDIINLQSMAIVNEGLMLVAAKDYKGARNALNEGLKLLETWTDDSEKVAEIRAEVEQALAAIALDEDRLTDAWTHATTALRHAKTLNQDLTMGIAYRTLGDAVTALQEQPATDDDLDLPENVDDYYQLALDALQTVGAEAEIGYTTFNYAQSLAKRGKRLRAAQLLREAIVIFSKLGMTRDVIKAAEAQLKIT